MGLFVGLTLLVYALVVFNKKRRNSLPPTVDLISDDQATQYVEALANKHSLRLIGTRLAKGRLTIIGEKLIVLSDPHNPGITEYEEFINEPFYRVLVGRKVEEEKFIEEYLYVHKASGEFCLLDKDPPGIKFTPDDIQPFHMSFVGEKSFPNEGAEYQGTADDEWDHHHASYP